jgi:hypothetical protein
MIILLSQLNFKIGFAAEYLNILRSLDCCFYLVHNSVNSNNESNVPTYKMDSYVKMNLNK